MHMSLDEFLNRPPNEVDTILRLVAEKIDTLAKIQERMHEKRDKEAGKNSSVGSRYRKAYDPASVGAVPYTQLPEKTERPSTKRED